MRYDVVLFYTGLYSAWRSSVRVKKGVPVIKRDEEEMLHTSLVYKVGEFCVNLEEEI
jgi:kynurenine formamidase